MGLLDEFLKEYQGGNLPAQNLSPLSAERAPTSLPQSYLLENNYKTTNDGGLEPGNKPGSDRLSEPKTNHRFSSLRVDGKNVTFVACVREDESLKTPSSTSRNPSGFPYPARPSDKGDNLECDCCPACGYWDGYGRWRMGPGRYCFYSAVFKGKAARPVPVENAQKACPALGSESKTLTSK